MEKNPSVNLVNIFLIPRQLVIRKQLKLVQLNSSTWIKDGK